MRSNKLIEIKLRGSFDDHTLKSTTINILRLDKNHKGVSVNFEKKTKKVFTTVLLRFEL